MTGIGIQGSLRGIPAALASALGLDGEAPDEPALPNRESSGDFPLVLAVDTPSGVGVNDGSLPGPYIPATVTVTFGAMKPCAVLPPATFACGRIELLDFGFDIDDKDPDVEVVDNSFASDAVRLPRFEDSKYSRGVVGLVTGSQRYPGAAVLTASAAARANTGMVRYLGPERAQNMVLAALPEAVIGKGHVQSWVVGSGVPEASVEGTDGDMQRDTIAALLKHYALGSEDENKDAYDMPPIVVDAGALDLLPERVPGQVVITPHAGEMAKLLNRFETAASTAEHADSHEPYTADDVRLNPLASAKRAHELTGATVLLKGAVTIVVDEDHVYASGSAPAWLGTAGAGDVLAGLTGALLAQSLNGLNGYNIIPSPAEEPDSLMDMLEDIKRKKAARKAAAAKQREVERKYYKPDTPRYKRLRLIWWILLIAAIGCTTLSFVGQQSLPPAVGVVTLILAYVFIIAAFVLDFWKIKKERVAYQERMLALEEKNAKAEKQARRVQQAKQVKAKGSGKNQNRHAAQKKGGEVEEDADAGAGESDEAPVKPARRGLFGSGFRLSNREKMQAEKKAAKEAEKAE